MGSFLESLKQLLLQFRPWSIILPWEQGIRIRFGKHVRDMTPGVWLRIPFVDQVYQQSVRLRSEAMSCQNVTTRDGKTIFLASQVSFAIGNLRLLFDTLQHVESTIINRAAQAIATYIQTHDFVDCRPECIAQSVTASLDFRQYGLDQVTIGITDYVVTKTYRLLSDQRWGDRGERVNNLPTA